MDQPITSETGHVTTPSSNRQVDEFLTKIREKANELNTNGITRGDQEILNQRLSFNWANEKPDGKRGSATLWRNARARRAYTEIQDANDHLFLVVVLVIPPTECAKTSFDNILNHLTSLENYGPYFLSLSSASKRYFESTAAEQGFAGSRRYLSFMQALFPQREEVRQIQLAYSDIPLANIPKLFEIMRKGIETSQQWALEREQENKTSGFVTALIPTGDKDGCFTITIGREDMMRSLRELDLTQLKL